ncbi:PTS glucose transporter subunit IIA [Streptococcus catagoni]|uniref:PTS sugar transporter subunit IIA n=1 Tax=Streptococcus catagoni TaxID=2654874 RepID=UPI0039A4E083
MNLEDSTEQSQGSLQREPEIILSPLDGRVLALENVKDQVFSSGVMGKGLAIKPSGNTIYAPVAGRVEVAFETGHAFAIKSFKGAEILIHIGIDTVSMAGQGFEPLVKAGQEVKEGDLLGRFDKGKIAAAGLEDTTMIVVTNTSDYSHMENVAKELVGHGQELIALK